MQHLDEGTIHSWLDGALSAEEAARVSAHVEECPQCAAAVAEARGFIAASSRILTALDNVPKGVVPGERAKPRNWAVWRAAAAVLVVALGSFAVLRERTGTQQSVSEVAQISARSPASDVVADSVSPGTAESKTSPTNEVPTAKVLAKPAAPARAANPLAFGKIENRGMPSQERASAPAVIAQSPAVANVRPQVRADNATSQNFGAATMKVAAEPLSGRAAGAASIAGASGAAMSDAGPTSIRVVGTPRVIGEKRTLYEVAPGDTVLLAEALRIELNSVVVTGVGVTRTTQSTDTSAGRQIRLRGATSRPVAPDSQRSNAAPSPAAAAPPASPTAALPWVQTLNGITTLTWTDPASGNTMRLSGKHSATELTEIRRRIEQLRAAEAAKKKP
jgi:hypothetical protein